MHRATACLVVLLATCVVPSTLAAAQLPPQLVARLQADRDRAETTLTEQREQLGAAATRQRVVGARSTKLRWYSDRLEPLLDIVGLPVQETTLGQASSDAEELADEAEATLETATSDTARAQAAALDADRRLRALERAAATQDERDSTLGSWRFGSGGPAVSADSLDRYLQSKGSPLAGQGPALLEAGIEHELDPRLLVAIAGAESYFGVTTCADFNAWGWGCPTSPFTFRSWAHAIDTVALGLREGYLDDGLVSVGEIHLRYAPPDAKNDPSDLNYGWADNVARFLVEQGGDPQDVDGVLKPSR